ncbi:MAG: response regulator [Bacteroidales bacterium]|nr:response regulator [Bacteroidales bacterium]
MFSTFCAKSSYFYSLFFLLTAIVLPSRATILTTRNGLPSSLVNDIRQTSDGYVWIATEDGLTRYDGAKCETYFHVMGDSSSLVSNYIRSCFESRNHNIYVGGLHGLMRYDKEHDNFINIPLMLPNGLTVGAYIMGIAEIDNGIMYIATSGHGLFKMIDGDDMARQMDGFTGYYINSILADSHNNVWISTSDRGNTRISGNGFVYIVKTENNSAISTFCESGDGNIYAASNTHGIMLYNATSDMFETVNKATIGLNVKTLYPYRGNILIGTDGHGIKEFNLLSGEISNFDMGALPFDTHKAKVHSIVADKWGGLWLGLFQRGVIVIPQNTNKFDYIGCLSTTRNIIGSNYVSQLFYATNGKLYVGTDNDGLYVIDRHTWQSVHYSQPSTTMSLTSDNDGNIWIGTFNEGLWLLNVHTGSLTRTQLLRNDNGPTPSINAIVPDDGDNIYIGTMGQGLYVYNTKTQQMKQYEHCAGVDYTPTTNKLHNLWISCMCRCGNKLFIGTQDGIGCLNTQTNSFVSEMRYNRILPDYTIIDITADSCGYLWAATNKGLIRINAQTTETQNFELSKGMAHEVFMATICDHQGNIWATSSHELLHIDTRSLNVTSYYEQDGILTTEFAKRSATITPDDHIFFGGTDGITHFYTNDVSTYSQPPIIKVADLYLKGQRVLSSTMSGRYKVKNDDNGLRYDLNYDDNSFVIELTTLQFIPQPHMSYSYTINNEPSIDAGNGINRISLRNIAPGEYHITIVGNNNGHTSEPITMNVVVHHAWWNMWWARLIYICTILLLCLLFYRLVKIKRRTKAQLAFTLHNQQMREAKMQMFTDIAHEIRTPMSLVISPLNNLISHDNDAERQKNYNIIYRNAQRILRLMTQILDIQKIDAGKMEMHFFPTVVSDIIKDVCITFDFEARAKNITLSTDTAQVENVAIEVDTRHFDKILTNLISNAIKYTPQDGQIVVRAYIAECAERMGQSYIIEVEDSGNGFSDDEARHMFDRFHRLAGAVNSSTVGFGVGLDLTRTLVELHHGTIKALNCPTHKGGLMRICLPYVAPTSEITTQNSNDNTETEQNADSDNTKGRRPKYTVLFVDDDKEICKYVSTAIGGKQFNVVTCANGQEAIKILLAEEIDIVVTDVVMPIMDGFTLCRNIKNNINISHIPVVILTSRSADTDRIESYENGADVYITKPFNTEVLLASLRSLIARRDKIRADEVAKDIVMAQKNVTELTFDEKLLKRITDLINKNIKDPNYSIEDLAKDVGISRVHLHRKMRELTGLTTRDFIRNVRMEYAGELLRNKKYEVGEVAIMTGYSTTSYFSQAFKAHFGISPSMYIAKYKKTKAENS